MHTQCWTYAQVVGLPEYQTWMKAFPEGTVHILAAAKKGCPVLESSAELQASLSFPYWSTVPGSLLARTASLPMMPSLSA